MRMRLVLISILLSLGAAAAVSAQGPDVALKPVAFSRAATPAGERFDATVANPGPDAHVQGHFVVLSVYDTRPPQTLPIPDFDIKSGAQAKFSVLWPDPPPIGEVRLLLVLSAADRASLVQPYGFWIIPWKTMAIALGALILLVAAFFFWRMRRFLRDRVPAGMVPYYPEPGDTVMSLSSRFDVTWEDLVKANRLTPPYEFRPGTRLLIPKHALKKPEAKP